MPEETTRYARERLEQEGIYKELESYGKHLFLCVSGAHNFGFPSKNSDIDIRGVYLAPKSRFLGLRSKVEEPAFQYFSEDKELDVSVDEVGHYLRLVSESNGNRLEWPNSRLLIVLSEEFESLKNIVNSAAISKGLFSHYLHFARNMWEGKTRAKGIKRDLYALRIYMTGITIFEDGEVISDINQLNQKFGYPIVNDLVQLKQRNEERSSEGYDRQELSEIIGKLDSRLIESLKKSRLSEKPDVEKIDNYLKILRK